VDDERTLARGGGGSGHGVYKRQKAFKDRQDNLRRLAESYGTIENKVDYLTRVLQIFKYDD
jgi:hypothetical protein